MDDYQSELEITLLSLRAHCATATADGQTTSVLLIKFVADILIGLVQDYHLHEARLDQILCSLSLTSPNHLASLEDILSSPLDLPTSSSPPVTRYEKCMTERYVDEAVRHNPLSGEHFWGTEGHSKKSASNTVFVITL